MTNNEINYADRINSAEWQSLKGKNVVIINTQWNEEIISSMTNKAVELFNKVGINAEIVTVPGAYELPYSVKKIAQRGNVDGILTIGCVIKGETFHFEAIALAASLNISTISAEMMVPTSFGVLTVNTLEQARERSQNNELNKGWETAAALLDMMNLK